MPPSSTNIETGSEQLDADLKEFFEICKSDKLEAIKEAISNEGLSSAEFGEIVPNSLIRLVGILSGVQFNFLVESMRKESIPLLREARSLMEEHFGNLLEHKAAREALRKDIKASLDSEESMADKSISAVTFFHTFAGSPPELIPAVKIAFKNKKGKILLDSYLDWEDLSFLLKAFSRVLVELLEAGKALVDLNQLDLSDAEKVGESLTKTLSRLRKITELAPKFKVKVETVRDEEAD